MSRILSVEVILFSQDRISLTLVRTYLYLTLTPIYFRVGRSGWINIHRGGPWMVGFV